jgi:hypothetical protein
LTGSVFTNWSGSKPMSHDAPGNYINFGVREFGMSADRQLASRCTAGTSLTSARSSRSRIIRETRCEWRRS